MPTPSATSDAIALDDTSSVGARSRPSPSGRVVLVRLAGAVAATHFAISMFILLGGVLVLWGLVPMWWHVPIAAWGVWVHLANWTCPLTPLEKWLRDRAGAPSYGGGFVEQYILPKRFRGRMSTRRHQMVGLGVLAVNVVIYASIILREK